MSRPFWVAAVCRSRNVLMRRRSKLKSQPQLGGGYVAQTAQCTAVADPQHY